MTRRKPKQQRSKDSVERIIRASIRIIDNEGIAALTTNHVAKVAGMGVGTIYDYFDDKEQILTLVLERELAMITRELEEQVVSVAHLPTRPAAQKILTFILERTQSKSELARALASQLYSTSDFPPVVRMAGQIESMVRLLIAQRSQRKTDEISMIAYLATHAIIGICSGVANGLPIGLSTEDAVNLIVDVLVQLIDT